MNLPNSGRVIEKPHNTIGRVHIDHHSNVFHANVLSFEICAQISVQAHKFYMPTRSSEKSSLF